MDMCIQGVEGQALNWGLREAEERYGNLLAGCADRAYVHWCPLYGGDRYSLIKTRARRKDADNGLDSMRLGPVTGLIEW